MKVEWHEVVPSTFEVAAARAGQGAPHGTVIAARRQTAGRGRQGRAWESPTGGLWLTLILRPPLVDVARPSLALRLAAAAAEAIEERSRCPIRLRWPNDLYVGERKLAGLLIEARWMGGRLESALVGFGMNVRVAADSWTPEVRQRATSLHQHGPEVTLDEMLEIVVGAMLDEIAAPSVDVRGRCATLGRSVMVRRDDGSEVSGRAVDLGPQGSLLVETPAGPEEFWTCQEVRLTPPSDGSTAPA
jgi:BirA family biotin operon repressor/biotin-[acetyl-CoA-carboxylase] ligase